MEGERKREIERDWERELGQSCNAHFGWQLGKLLNVNSARILQALSKSLFHNVHVLFSLLSVRHISSPLFPCSLSSLAAACVAIVVAKFGVKICILFTACYNACSCPLRPQSACRFPLEYKFMANPCTMKKAFRRFTTILRNLFWFITKVLFFSGVIVDSFFMLHICTFLMSNSPAGPQS